MAEEWSDPRLAVGGQVGAKYDDDPAVPRPAPATFEHGCRTGEMELVSNENPARGGKWKTNFSECKLSARSSGTRSC